MKIFGRKVSVDDLINVWLAYEIIKPISTPESSLNLPVIPGSCIDMKEDALLNFWGPLRVPFRGFTPEELEWVAYIFGEDRHEMSLIKSANRDKYYFEW